MLATLTLTVRLGPVGCTALAILFLAGCDRPASSGQGKGDLTLCNSTASRIGVALGYQDATGWTTEGWWNISPRTCETIYKGALSSRFWYVHAIDYDRGGEWAGKAAMCTIDKTFTIRGTENCTQRGFKSTSFFEVDTQDAEAWTIKLTDPGEGGARPK